MWKFGIFGRKAKTEALSDDRKQITAQLNVRMQPTDRSKYFEGPLDKALKEAQMGEVTGGGTQLTDEPDGIKHCDVEIEVHEFSEETIQKIVQVLEGLGAPKGSNLKFPSEKPDIPFGQAEGMGLFLNGTDLPDHVYANSDINKIISELGSLLIREGMFRGYWEGSRETALYFYGIEFEKMKQAVSKYLETEPMCEKARVVQIA